LILINKKIYIHFEISLFGCYFLGDSLYLFIGFVDDRSIFLDTLVKAYKEVLPSNDVKVIPATNIYNVDNDGWSRTFPNAFKLRDGGIDPFSIIFSENGNRQKVTLYFFGDCYVHAEGVKSIFKSLLNLGLKEEEFQTKELTDLLKPT